MFLAKLSECNVSYHALFSIYGPLQQITFNLKHLNHYAPQRNGDYAATGRQGVFIERNLTVVPMTAVLHGDHGVCSKSAGPSVPIKPNGFTLGAGPFRAATTYEIFQCGKQGSKSNTSRLPAFHSQQLEMVHISKAIAWMEARPDFRSGLS